VIYEVFGDCIPIAIEMFLGIYTCSKWKIVPNVEIEADI
jgi:hypothetical protein